jgi:hypothetical protein
MLSALVELYGQDISTGYSCDAQALILLHTSQAVSDYRRCRLEDLSLLPSELDLECRDQQSTHAY